jgi:hypothetical protein
MEVLAGCTRIMQVADARGSERVGSDDSNLVPKRKPDHIDPAFSIG